MRTPSNSPRRFVRATAVGLTLLVVSVGGVGSAAADESDASPLAVLAPVSNAFSDTEETSLDQFLNGVVPEEASPVIGLAFNAVEATTSPEEGSGDTTSATGEDDTTAITVAPVDEPAAKAKPRHGKDHPRPRR